MSQYFVGPASVTRELSDGLVGQFFLTCVVTGESWRAWSKLDADARNEAILSHLVAYFGSENGEEIRTPLEIFEVEWVKNAWSKGFPPPSNMTEVG
jgi:monoamine oxidase